ncbi:serine hydrolase [Paenibacillus elgii]|uniref:serine hydrolase n=1 Tax=Paenibacillus elgii TaxID=189691 RepID=UPI000248CCC3|nr:serine hydrolase [Paenibacillus elgii]
MKKMKPKLNMAALFLCATALMTACTPSDEKPESAQAVEKTNLNGPQDAKEVEAYADSLFAEVMKKHNVNGSNFAVVKDGKVLVNKGYGYADKEKKTPVDKNTVFQIGSVTKTFTGLAANQLADQGKIDLNEDIQKYLGGMKIPNKTDKKLTMFDLLTYRTGVDFPDITSYYSPENAFKDIPMKQFLLDHMPTVVRPPGEAYTYDNFGFMLAGYAIENVSGMTFNQYMDKNVFKPLGMNSTSTRLTPELNNRMAAHYDMAGALIPMDWGSTTDGPQGSIISTSEDMAKYLTMLLQKGKYGDQQLVSEKTAEQMFTYQVVADKSIPQTTVGGFEGYRNELANGQHVVIKGGNVTGHQSLIVLVPEKNTAFYMSYNHESVLMSMDVYEAFMDHYFPEAKTLEKPVYVNLDEKDAEKYLGLYENTRFMFLKSKFSYADGKLQMETGNGKHTFKMITPLLFEDESGNKLAFKKDHRGSIEYFYYNTLEGPHFVSDSQKIHGKQPFSDVAEGSKYKSFIDDLHALDIMGAKSGSRFEPQATMTQSEFADVLLRAQGWYAIPWAFADMKKQLQTGFPSFDPNAITTRQTAAVMIQALKGLKPASKVQLSGQTDASAVEAVTALVSQGVIDPDTTVQADGSVDFRSNQPLLRQEAAALLDKAFGHYALPLPIK